MARILVVLGLSLVGGLYTVGAADPAADKTPLEIAAEEMALRAQLAESRLKEEQAKRELEKLDDPESSFEPDKHGLALKDKAGYYGELLSFVTLEDAAARFVRSLIAAVPTAESSKTKILVSSDYELSKAGALWHLTDAKLGEFETAFPSVFPPLPVAPKPEALPAVASLLTSTLGAASELAAFFRVKRELAGREVSPSTESLIALVVKHLKEKHYEPMLPRLVVQYETGLAKRVQRIRELGKEAQGRRKARKSELKAKGFDIDEAAENIAEITKELKADPGNVDLKKKLAALVSYKAWWDEHSANLKETAEEFAKFLSRLETVPEKATQSPIEQLYAYETLVTGAVKLLVARTVSQGTDVESSSGALRRTKLSYVGGSVCVFYVSDVRGGILAADVIPVVMSRSFTGRIGTQPPSRVE